MRNGGGTQRCISILNLVTMVMAMPVVGSGFWLASKHDSECTRFLQTPILCIGFLMLFLSMAGFVGSCWSVRWILWIYLFVMFLVILTLLGFTTFALAVTSNESQPGSAVGSGGGGSSAVGSIHQYQLSYYSGWLTHRVRNPVNWNKIKSCLADAKVCASNDLQRPSFLPNFLYRHLNPLQLGCCKPPAVCQYTNVKGTIWEDPMNATATEDCGLWSNEPWLLCLACSTCKAGLLANLKRDWSKVALLNVSLLAFLLLVYALACCVFQNATKRDRRRRRRRNLCTHKHPLPPPSPPSSDPTKPLTLIIIPSPPPPPPLKL